MQITSDYYRDKAPTRRSGGHLGVAGSRTVEACSAAAELQPLRPSVHTLRQLAKVHRSWRSR